MSGDSVVKTVGLPELKEWLLYLGLLDSSEQVSGVGDGNGGGGGDGDGAFQNRLRDGIVLCQLVNKIRPGSIDNIKPKRSSGDAEENILRFLQACTILGIKKIFRPADLLDPAKDIGRVMVTLQLLYNVAVDHGLGLKIARKSPVPVTQNENGLSPEGSEEVIDEDENEGHVMHAKAIYPFTGTSDDELQFSKGDIIKVTNIVEGGWWKGLCNGKVGWFPGNFVEEIAQEGVEANAALEDDAHHYHKLVVLDILESERSFVHDLNEMLSTYLYPLKISNVLLPREVDLLTGNLPELTKKQHCFLMRLEECSKFPVLKQNFGATFLECMQEIETLYGTYCANHPKAVAVLTENSDKLSAFMESNGAASPGILTLTSNLSKPFRRLEKYAVLLKELQRHMIEGHADAGSVDASILAYKAISTRTQEIRKRKEMEYEMLSSPVKGFNGSSPLYAWLHNQTPSNTLCLSELGECKCVVVANQALNAEEVEEVYFLVFPACFIILGVGQSLSGYEIKNNFVLSAVSVKKAQYSEEWPWPVELQHKSDLLHASLSSEADQRMLLDVVGRVDLVHTPTVPRSPHMLGLSAGSKALSRADSAQIFKTAYPTRRSSVNIQRQHHWGFKSLRPMPPLKTQQLIALRERDKSPKSAKKFAYPIAKKKRASKYLEELLASVGGMKVPVDNKAGDSDILRVIEAYCAGGRGAVHSNEPVTYIDRTRKKSMSMDRATSRAYASSSAMEPSDTKRQEIEGKSCTLPGSRSKLFSYSRTFTNLDFPSCQNQDLVQSGGHNIRRAASTIGKSPSFKRSIFRRRADSVDNTKHS